MSPFLLTALSFTILAVLHHSLKVVFHYLEKAQELSAAEPRNNGAEQAEGKAV